MVHFSKKATDSKIVIGPNYNSTEPSVTTFMAHIQKTHYTLTHGEPDRLHPSIIIR